MRWRSGTDAAGPNAARTDAAGADTSHPDACSGSTALRYNP